MNDPDANTGPWLPISAEGGDILVLSQRQTDSWTLVLAARQIPYRTEHCEKGWQLLVPAADFEAALVELRLFEAENHNWPPPLPPAAPLAENRLATLSVLVLVATFHNITLLDIDLFGHYPVDWLALGNAHAGKILEGQWWRLITALTLHTDGLHLLSNLAIGGVFVIRLCRELGGGLAWCLVLGTGFFGNLVNAWLQHPDHRAVGASTAVFGALGLLAAINLVRYRRNLARRLLLPIAAALALLAFLGTEGERTDVGAHLFGFGSGVLLGVVTGYVMGKFQRPGQRLNALLGLGSAAAVLAAWGAALYHG